MIWLWQLYIAASLLLIWGFIAVIWARGGAGSGSYEFMRLAVYTVPGLLAIGFKWIVERRGFRRAFPELGVSWGRMRFWPLIILVPAVAITVSHGIPALSGITRLDPSLSGLAEEIARAGQPIPPDIWGFFWAKLGLSLSLGLLIFLPIAALAEMGFRAYPLELLSERFGPRLTLALVGTFWAVALFPFLFLRNPYGSWLGIPVYLGFSWGWGSLMAWLYTKARTVLVPALCLIILDVLDQSLSYILPGNPLLSGTEGVFGAGFLVIIGCLVVAFTDRIYIPPKKPKPDKP